MVNIVSRYAIGLEGANRFDSFFESPYSKDFQKFWGFDARQGYDPELFDVARFEEYCGRPPKNAEVGCTWSHLNVYKRFLEESTHDDDILIVAEDDAIIDADIDSVVSKVFELYPDLGGVVLSDGYSWEAHRQNPYVEYSRISLLSKFVDLKHRIGPYGGHLFSTGLYAITRKAVENIIHILEVNNGYPYWCADNWGLFGKEGHIKVYALRPGICYWAGDSLIADIPFYLTAYEVNKGGDRSLVDRIRVALAPRARWSNFKTSLEATKKHIAQMRAR